MKKIVLFFICLVLSAQCLDAKLVLASGFTDNAVLQQNKPIAIWGESDPGSTVEVTLGDARVGGIAGEDGKWLLYLPARKGGYTEYQLNVTNGKDSITLDNILIGEVWLASGQSNMDYRFGWNIKNMEQEMKDADLPAIRYFETWFNSKPDAVDYVAGAKWEVCSPETVGGCSAVAFFFAKNLHLDQDVPVGIIVSAIGATRLESWISRDALATVPGYRQHVENWDFDQQKWDAMVVRINKANQDRGAIADTSSVGLRTGVTKLEYNDKKWGKMMFPCRVADMGYPGYWGMVWVRKTIDLPSDFNPDQKVYFHLPVGATGDKIYLNGEYVKRDLSYTQDKSFYLEKNALRPGKNILAVNMFITWGVGGIGTNEDDCYLQLENGSKIDLTKGWWRHSNKIEPALPPYEDCSGYMSVNFNGMIHPFIPYSIRGFLWYQGEANSLEASSYAGLQAALVEDWRVRFKQGYLPFLYVQLANYCPAPEEPQVYDDWSAFRNAQTDALYLSENVGMACTIDVGETNDIHPKNKQDVGKRLYLIAKAKVYEPDSDTEYSGPMMKSVKRQGNEIVVTYSHANGLYSKSGNDKVTSFALQDAKNKIVWAEAGVRGETVVVKIPKGFKPVKIQYAYGNNPQSPLYNSAELPAVPFKVDIPR